MKTKLPIVFNSADDYYCQVGIEVGYLSAEDRQFIAKMLKVKASRKDIEKWFNNHANDKAWSIAQGVLAACYGMDPP